MAEYKACANEEMAIEILDFIKQNYEKYSDKSGVKKYIEALQMGIDALTADVVEVDVVSEQIIRKKAEVSDYWLKYVKSYLSTQGYSDIEHDVDNFLRGYNEAVEDMLAILDGKQHKDATMISDREKLIKLLNEIDNHPEKTCPHFNDNDCFNCKYDTVNDRCDMTARKADYLITNGVTVQKQWIKR